MRIPGGYRALEERLPAVIALTIMLMSHWIVQGVLYMDRTEAIFKLVSEIVLIVPLYFLFESIFDPLPAFAISLFISHSTNFVVNGQPFCVLKRFNLVENEFPTYECMMDRLSSRASETESIRTVLVLGSLVREELNKSSDLDVRIIRKRGFQNAILASLFVMRERLHANLIGFPLDVYLLDNPGNVSDIDKRELDNIHVLYDSDDVFG